MTTHLICLARHFLSSDPTPTQQTNTEDLLATRQRILPDRGQCPSCSTNLRWGDLIKGCYRRNNKNKQSVANDVESDADDEEEEQYYDEIDGSGNASEGGEDEIAALDDHPICSGIPSSTNRNAQLANQSRNKKPQASNPTNAKTYDDSEVEDEIAALASSSGVRFSTSTTSGSRNIQSSTSRPRNQGNSTFNSKPTKTSYKPSKSNTSTHKPNAKSISLNVSQQQTIQNNNKDEDEQLQKFMKNLTIKKPAAKPSRPKPRKKPIQLTRDEDEDEPEDEIMALMNDLQVSDDSD